MGFLRKDLKKEIHSIIGRLSDPSLKLPDNWWWWDKKLRTLEQLSEEDDNILDDILSLREYAMMLEKSDIVKKLESAAFKLKRELQNLKAEIDAGYAPDSEQQEHQKNLLESMIAKLSDDLGELESSLDEIERFLDNNTVVRKKHKFIFFFRAEHISDRPLLNEDTSGQFGKGVYFAMDENIVKRFRTKPSCIFKFFITRKLMMEELRPIFISKEEMQPLENMDPIAFQEYLVERGYGNTSYCVIGPMPDFNYEMQMLIDTDSLHSMIESGDITWERGEEFNI